MKNKGRRFLVGIGILIITLSIIAVAIIFMKPNSESPIEIIGIIISSIIGVSTLIFVIKEYKRARNIEEGEFIVNLNSTFITNDDIKYIYDKIYWESKGDYSNPLGKEDVTKIVSYLTFLETFWTMLERRIITIDMINDLFANRFFMMVTNPSVQDLKLVSEYKVYNNIRKLEQQWRKYRIKKGCAKLFYENAYNKNVALQIANQFYMEKKTTKGIVNNFEFKLLNVEYIDQVIKLQDEVIDGLSNSEWLKRTSEEDYKMILEDGENICCGVFDSNELIGYCFLQFPKKSFLVYKKRFLLPFLHNKCMYFKVVVINEKHRNKGLQSAFLQVALEYAKFYEINRIIATVHPDNKVSNLVFNKSNFALKKTKAVHNNEPRNIYEYKL